ncbi:MAG: DNA polymerase I [Bacteroidota bacterium]
MPDDKRLFLLDAMALIYRAYYALNKNPHVNSKGLNTSAILGFANTIYEVLKNEKPTHIGVAFDTQAPTVRHDDFAMYKANREAMPDDISLALPYIKRLIEAFNIPIIMMEGYEADDIIGTLSVKAEQAGFTTYMMTSDKDFGQLVTEKTFIYKPAKFGVKAEVLGVKEVCEKFSIKEPKQLIDLLGLWGDASDNIPGIPGFGEVTAKKLIAEFGSIEELIRRSSEISNPRWRSLVETHKDIALQSKSLATIILDVPVEFHEENLHLGEPDREVLRELLDELEFRTFANRVFTDLSVKDGVKPAPVQQTQPSAQFDLFSSADEKVETVSNKRGIADVAHDYYLIDTPEKRRQLIEKLKSVKSFCFDTETTGIDHGRSELIGFSFAIKPHEAWYVALPENYNEAYAIVAEFKDLFEDAGIAKTGQNLKFDIAMLRWYDIEVNGTLFDTMIAHYLLQPDQRHNMDFLSETYLDYSPVPIESLIGKKGKGQGSMRNVPLDQLCEYAAEDADVTLQLRNVFLPELKKTNTEPLFNEIETPLIPVLAAMEAEGIKIDKQALNDYSAQLLSEVKQLELDIFQMAGTEFNISSPKQLGDILFDRLKIAEKPKKTATKQYSTAEDVLAKLLNKHPIVQAILDYRSLTKLKSTYVDTLPEMINPRTGRVHTSFNQAVAATGRLSSNNPNLQNIPIRTERGREIRKAFVPRNDDYVLLSADYSQIELRIIASISGEKHMIEDFKNGLDIHAATAARVYGIDVADVTKDMRRNAKMVNFGIIYGISAFGLSERLGIPRKEAAEIIEQYFEKYPSIKKFMNDTIESARKNGYVETIKNRRRYLRDINAGNGVIRGFAERNAINAPIQGSAADMIKIAMINIHKYLREHKMLSKMVLQVHDELVFDVHQSELEQLKPVVIRLMQDAVPLLVPVEVDINSGKNWLEAH